MELVETNQQAATNVANAAIDVPAVDPAAKADVAAVDAVKPPDLPTVLGTMADLIEHSGLHHNAKFSDFVGQVRAFQRSIA